jgi:hypothetical protein
MSHYTVALQVSHQRTAARHARRHPEAPLAPARRPLYTYDYCRIAYRPLQRVRRSHHTVMPDATLKPDALQILWRDHRAASGHARGHPEPLGAAPPPLAH